MRKCIIFLCIVIKVFSQETDDNLHLSPEFESDTLFTINEDTFHISINRKVDMQTNVKTESFSDNGEKYIMFYADNFFNLSFVKNNRQIFAREFYKKDFANTCGVRYLADKILHNIRFERFNFEENASEFSVTIFRPDTDVVCEILLKLSEDGNFRILASPY